MKSYDDRLETLLLEKDFAELTAEEQAHVARVLGDAAAYAAARALRLRGRAALAAESAPQDPEGLAAVMARTRRRKAVVIPLWQAAAAVLLATLLAWWGRGWGQSEATRAGELIAAVDTVLREVRVVDTVYLPAPQAETHPLVQAAEQRKPGLRRKAPRWNAAQPRSPQLAVALATLPAPAVTARSGGGAGIGKLPDAVVPWDKLPQ